MDRRKSFKLYVTQYESINKLSTEQKAELLDAIFGYHNGVSAKLSQVVDIVFTPIKQQFQEDEEHYNRIIERNNENGKKGGRPKKENPTKPNKTQNNPLGFQEQSLVVVEKQDKRDTSIDQLIDLIKETLIPLQLIYKHGSHERNRARNILTAKEFGETCQNAHMTREKFVVEIIKLSARIPFWKGKIYNCETFYDHYAKVYNEGRRIKDELEQKNATKKKLIF